MPPLDDFQRAHLRKRVLAAPRKGLLQLFTKPPFGRLFDVSTEGFDVDAPDVVGAGSDAQVSPLFVAKPHADLTGEDIDLARHLVECLDERRVAAVKPAPVAPAREDASATETLKNAIREIVAARQDRTLTDHEVRRALLERGIEVDTVSDDAVVIRFHDASEPRVEPERSASAEAAIARYRALLGI